MLEVLREKSIEDPTKAKKRIEDHGQVVDPRVLIAEHVAEKGVGGVWVTET